MTLDVSFVTLGCPKNEADTEAMRAAVAASSYRLVDDLEKADVVVLNTCSFIQEATEESIAATLELASSWVPKREGRKLILAGCMPSRYGGELQQELGEVHGFLPVAREGALLELIEQITGVPSKQTTGSPGEPSLQRTRVDSAPSAYVKISDGCDRTCTYCAIPAIRGAYRSRPREEILREVGDLVSSGTREIVFIGQDTTVWGRDLPENSSLASLLAEAARTHPSTWFRVMYLQPETTTTELIDTIGSTPNICSYFDIPLQHASKRVLRAMGRAGSYETFLELVHTIRDRVPDATLRTTLIAGFPGETRSEAAELLRFVEEAQFDYTGVFVYSPEEGTAAAGMSGQIPLRTRRARAQRLRDAGDRIGFLRCQALVGRELDVLIEEIDEGEDVPGAVAGRWMGQAPEIDGQVHVKSGMIGSIERVLIEDAFCYELEGKRV